MERDRIIRFIEDRAKRHDDKDTGDKAAAVVLRALASDLRAGLHAPN